MDPYYQDEHVTLHHGDAHAVLSSLDPGSVDCIVTSPPYYGLRDYGVDGQIGAEASPAEYVENMRALFAEARRVLADDGTLWLNIGDSYSTYAGNRGASATGFSRNEPMPAAPKGAGLSGDRPAKNLLGIPWRVAFALQDDGWILRNDIIWAKPNAMPESITDRLSARHEHLFLLSKSPRYHFDLDAIREDRKHAAPKPYTAKHEVIGPRFGGNAASVYATGEYKTAGKNPGDVWSIPTQRFSEAHFAVYPLALPERCILAGTRPGGTVLDPFSGSGTTGMAAAKHGRRYVGIDLNADYLDLSLRTRLQQPGLDMEGIA